MSIHGLQKLIWQAVVDDDFRTGVLNGRRAELIREVELDEDEAKRILAIRTESLPDFANGVLEIMHTRYPRPAPPWLENAWSSSDTPSNFASL
jgi:hypothetical protein